MAIATTRGPKSRRAGRHCWPTDAARARAPNGVGGLAIPAARPAPTTELGDTVAAGGDEVATRAAWVRLGRGLSHAPGGLKCRATAKAAAPTAKRR